MEDGAAGQPSLTASVEAVETGEGRPAAAGGGDGTGWSERRRAGERSGRLWVDASLDTWGSMVGTTGLVVRRRI